MTRSTRPLSYTCFFIFIGILCATTPLLLRGQPPSNDILEQRRDSQTLLLTIYSDILTDSTLLVNFDSLQRSPDRFPFKALGKEELNMPEGVACWLRFKVKNSDIVPIQRYVAVYQRAIERLQLFVVDEQGQVDSSVMIGCLFPYGTQPIATTTPSFPIIFDAQKTYTLYLYIDARSLPVATPIYLNITGSTASLANIHQTGFLIGLGFLFVCIAFSMFWLTRRALYFSYFIYTSGGVGYVSAASNFGYEHVWSNLPFFEGISENVFASVGFMGFMLITIYFFDTPQYFPKLDKVLKGVVGIGLAVILAAFLRNVLPHGFYMKTCVLGALGIVIALPTMLVVTIWSYYMFRRKESMYFLLGFSSFLVAVTFILLTEIGFTAFRYWAHNVMPHFTLFFEFSTLLLLLGYRLKEEWVKQKLKEIQLLHTLSEQRNRISRDLHDDVGSTLNSIAVFSEVALQQIRLTNPQSVPVLERIGDASRHLIDTINDIVWVINPKNDQFKDTILRMRLFAADLLMPRNVVIDFVADERLNATNLSVEQRKHFYLIFKEVVNNVYKYAACTVLTIKIERCNTDICMTIVDNGKGFDRAHPKNGNGLKSMQDRAEILRGVLSVTSQLEKGTSVSLRFPIDETKNKEEQERPQWVGQEAVKSNIFVGIKLF